jgi:hypothetical protein
LWSRLVSYVNARLQSLSDLTDDDIREVCDFEEGMNEENVIPKASADLLGCVRVGDGLNVDESGVLSNGFKFVGIDPRKHTYRFTSSTSMVDAGVRYTIPANTFFNLTAAAVYSATKPTAVMIEVAENSSMWAESYVANNNATATLAGFTEEPCTIVIKAKYSAAGANSVYLGGYYITTSEVS